MHPKIKLLVDLGTNKLKQSLAYSKNLVGQATRDMKNKLDDLKAPAVNLGRLRSGLAQMKSMLGNAAGFFRKRLLPESIDAPTINTSPLASGISSIKRMILAAGIGALLTGGIGTSIASGMEATKNQVSFEVLGGKEKGNKLFGDLTQFAQESIFGNEVYGNAKTLLGFGVAIDDVMPRLKMLGDISMGDKEKLGSLTLAFAQMTAAGRLMGQDVLQMVNAGFNPLKEISDMTGESMASLKDKMEKGAISANLVNKAFEHATGPAGRFYQMTQKIAGTAAGQWEALKGQVQGIAMQFGLALLPAVSKVFEAVKPLLDQLPAVLQQITPVISAIFDMGTQVLTALEPVFALFQNVDTGGFLTELKANMDAVIEAVAPVIEELAPLFQAIIETVWPLAQQLREFAVHLITKLGPTLKNIAHILSNVLGPAIKIVGWLLGKVIDVLSWVVDKVATVLEWVTGIFSKLSDGVKWLMDKMGVTIGDGTESVIESMKQKVGANSLQQFFEDTGKKHGQAYLDALFLKYEAAARIMDRLYHTTAWSDNLKRVKDKVTGKGQDDPDGLNPDSVTPGRDDKPTKTPTTTPEKISGNAHQAKTINIRFDSYIKGDVLSKNVNIANMSSEQLERFLREHFLRLIHGTEDSYA